MIALGDQFKTDANMHIFRASLASFGLMGLCAHAEERLPTIAPAQYSAEQKQAAAEFEAARKVPVFGPFEPLMYSPSVMSQARAMGDYLRYKSAIGNTLSELAILLTAREWSQDFEWSVHYPIALKAGIRPEIADAIAEGRRPVSLSPDEEMVYDYAMELLKNKQVSNSTFEHAKTRFGAKGVVDLTGIVGYYTFLAMQLNAAQYPIAKDAKKLPRMPP
jgi:4-carboxymuconolactone decarboxylase